ncbi:MAG TPA: DUF58 domain-containing protein [Acidimicrobiales bacterium]|nr:DUF58 domain-containing protein [Acidimicrobiales bacterium]
MSPTPRVAWALAALAVAALLVPVPAVVLGALVLAAATVVDALAVRRPPEVARRVPTVLARGVPAPLTVTAARPGARRLLVRQPATPDVRVEPSEADGQLDAMLVPRRRGRHRLPAVATRAVGPLGLGRWDHGAAGEAEVAVYPDVPAARRLALAVRQGRFGEQGRLRRGPLGLGTEFESVRDYSPDDDIRQVNWRVTARLERPMSNTYRVDQDRDVVVVVDAGRLMAAPLAGTPPLTRLDAALDAATAVALVADEMGDRCGSVAFDAEVRRRLPPRRRGGRAVVETLFDLEPAPVDSDYELAFRTVGRAKRSLVVVLTDLVEEAAARPLVDAVPVLARRHAVVVASVADPDLVDLVRTPPATPLDAYAASVAVEVLDARARVVHQLRRAGAEVVEAPPGQLAAACVAAYLELKRRARV